MVIIPITHCFLLLILPGLPKVYDYIQYIKGDLSFSQCSPLTADWPSFSPSCIRSICIRFHLRSSELHQLFPTASASVHSSRSHFLRVFAPTVCLVMNLAYFLSFCVFATALNTSSCKGFAVFHTYFGGKTQDETSQPLSRNGFRFRWVICTIDPTDF